MARMTRALVVASCLLACSQPGAGATGGAPQTPPPATPEPAPKKPAEPAPAPFAPDDRAAVRAALAQAGVEFGDDDCIEWPGSFPRVVVVGSFAHDRGCRTTGLFVDRTYLPTGGDVAGLATRDFVAARLADKEAIARAWIDEVVHAFGGEFVTEPTPAFTFDDLPKYTPVIVRENKIGGVVVEGWTAVPPGMNDESAFVLMHYQFAPDGALTAESRQRFAVDGQRLRDRKQAGTAPPTSLSVDMTRFDLTCTRDADCTVVRPHPCGPCGCANTPLARRDEPAFRAAVAAISCPPATPLTGGAGCGGCPGYKPRCDAGKCTADTH